MNPSACYFFILGLLVALSAIGNVVVHAQAPLPSCTSIGISSESDCGTQCTHKGSSMMFFRGAHGVNECACHLGKLCNDNPSCAELLIEPGKAEVQCRAYCPQNSHVRFDDYAQFPGNPANVHIEQTHLVVSCTCNGQQACKDLIFFSDRSKIQECMDVGIDSQATCLAKCNSYGVVFLGYQYESRDFGRQSVCTCTGPNGEPKAPYCEDLDRRPPGMTGGAVALTPVVTTAVMSSLVVLSVMI